MSIGLSEVSGNSFQLQEPAAKTSTFNGTGIDISDYEGKIAIILTSAAGTGTTPTLDVKIQDSATVGGTYGDVSGATFTQVTDAAVSTQQILVDADEVKQAIRIVGTIAGTTPSFTMAVVGTGQKHG